MHDTVISVEQLSKRYVIGHQVNGRDGLRHKLDDAFRNPVRWLRARKQRREAAREEFWALKNVAFEVKQGDAVAIIGRNGAGKSTLLKILSRITEPTTGRIQLRGRVASLLEVGTGFHQELTGRENIFLNGAILGMSKAEIKRKFDEIVAFSEIEKFLDTPVKRYSSGMYVRLAFAVAAHLEPEILIVDEVLAVGDAAFQKKCLGKMEQVAHGGRTVIFVSHNMPAVQALCNRAVYLRSGRVEAVGDIEPVIQGYLAQTRDAEALQFIAPRNLGEAARLMQLEVSPNSVEAGQSLQFSLSLFAAKRVVFTDLSLLIFSAQGARVALLDFRSLGAPFHLPLGQTWQIDGAIESLPLVEGEYTVGLAVNTGEFFENVLNLTSFTVTSRRQNHGYAPYPVVYRGTVDLNYNVSAVVKHGRDAVLPAAYA